MNLIKSGNNYIYFLDGEVITIPLADYRHQLLSLRDNYSKDEIKEIINHEYLLKTNFIKVVDNQVLIKGERVPSNIELKILNSFTSIENYNSYINFVLTNLSDKDKINKFDKEMIKLETEPFLSSGECFITKKSIPRESKNIITLNEEIFDKVKDYTLSSLSIELFGINSKKIRKIFLSLVKDCDEKNINNMLSFLLSFKMFNLDNKIEILSQKEFYELQEINFSNLEKLLNLCYNTDKKVKNKLIQLLKKPPYSLSYVLNNLDTLGSSLENMNINFSNILKLFDFLSREISRLSQDNKYFFSEVFHPFSKEINGSSYKDIQINLITDAYSLSKIAQIFNNCIYSHRDAFGEESKHLCFTLMKNNRHYGVLEYNPFRKSFVDFEILDENGKKRKPNREFKEEILEYILSYQEKKKEKVHNE